MKKNKGISTSFLKVVRSIRKRGMIKTAYKIAEFIGGLGLISRPGRIRAYWYETPEIKNFGDMLTPYLIQKITGEYPELVNEHSVRTYYVVCGSIMRKINRKAIVWGAGIMKKDDAVKRPEKVFAVRGPLTRQRLLDLGYLCPETYGDPALLLPLFYNPPTTKQYEIGIIPHYVDYEKVQAMNLQKEI